ncbi:MAG: hypothetical protein C7B43_14010, partial [Sulfobacillus benefaciens]
LGAAIKEPGSCGGDPETPTSTPSGLGGGRVHSVTNGSIWSPVNSTAYLAAAAALRGWDPTHDALFFYNPSLPFNRWMTTLPITAAIASQVFCR